MPIRSRAIPRLRMTVSVVSGVLTADSLKQHREAAVTDARYDPSFGLLFDLRRVTAFELTADDLRHHADRARRYSCIAIVAPTDVGFGLSRVYQAHRGDYDEATFGVFRNGGEALSWLQERLFVSGG